MRVLAVVGAGLLGLAASCGGPQPPIVPPHDVAAPRSSESPTAPTLAPSVDPFLDSALVGAVDVAAVVRMFGSELASVEHMLALPHGALTGPASIGVDTSRPLTVMIARPTPAQEAILHAVEPFVPAAEPSGRPGRVGLVDACKRVLGSGTHVLARVAVPTTDGSRTVEVLRRALDTARAHPAGDDVFVIEGHALRISRAASSVNVDVDLVTSSQGLSRDAADAVRSVPVATAPPAPLGQRTAHVVYDPRALGRLGFLWGIALSVRALSETDAIEPSQRDAIGAQGLWEASRAMALAESDRGPYFARVTVDADLGATERMLVLRAEPGQGFPASASAALEPGSSIAIGGAEASIDVSIPLLASWPLLGGDLSQRGGERVVMMAHEAGTPGLWLATAHAPFVAATRLLDDEPLRGLSLARFDRAGLAFLGAEERPVGYVVLRRDATQGQAECALSSTAEGCTDKLRANTTVRRGASFARVTKLGDRWVVLLGGKRGVESTPVLRRDAPPLSATIGGAVAAKLQWFGGLFFDGKSALHGDIRRDGQAMLMTIRVAPGSKP